MPRATACRRAHTMQQAGSGANDAATNFSRDLLSEPVAYSPERMKQRAPSGHVELASEPHDLDIDDVVQGSKPAALLPYVSFQHFAGYDLPLMSHQELQDIHFPWRQGNLFTGSKSRPSPNVESQVLTLN